MRIRCATSIALCAGLLGPAAAGAAVTSTTLTAPASPHYALDLEGDDAVTVTGAAPGAADGDLVDFVCFHAKFNGDLNAKLVREDVAVTGGAFSAPVPRALLANTPCRLRAVPAGTTAEDSAFASVLMLVGTRNVDLDSLGYRVQGGPNDGRQHNLQVIFQQGRGSADVQSSLKGLLTNAVDPATQRESSAFWSAGGALGAVSPAFPQRSSVVIDGLSAYGPDTAATQLSYASAQADPALPTMTLLALTHDAATGNGVVRFAEPFVACAGQTPACDSFVPTGVTLVREVAVDDAGQSATVRDRWTSTDGQPHDLDVLYDSLVRPAANPAWGTSWTGAAYSTRVTGDELTLPPGRVSTLRARNATGTCTTALPCGSLTQSTRPSLLRFSGASELEARFTRRIAGNAAVPIDLTFTTAASDAELATLAGRAEQAALAGLAVALTGPAESVTSRSNATTVTGRATTRSGAAPLRLNGNAITTAPDGTFSVPVTLTEGANTFTATLTDHAGDTVTATRTISFTRAPEPPQPPADPGPSLPDPPVDAVPASEGRTVVRAARFTGTGFQLTLSCVGPETASCSGRADIAAPITKFVRGRKRTRTVKLGGLTYTIPGNKRQVWTARITKAGAAEFKRVKSLRAKVTARFTVDRETRTSTFSFTARRPKAPAKRR